MVVVTESVLLGTASRHSKPSRPRWRSASFREALKEFWKRIGRAAEKASSRQLVNRFCG
jgi:hypothetical protein